MFFKCVPSYARDGSGKVVKANLFFPLTDFITSQRLSFIFASDHPWRALTLNTSAPGLPSPPSSAGSLLHRGEEENLGGKNNDLFAKCRFVLYLSTYLPTYEGLPRIISSPLSMGKIYITNMTNNLYFYLTFNFHLNFIF